LTRANQSRTAALHWDARGCILAARLPSHCTGLLRSVRHDVGAKRCERAHLPVGEGAREAGGLGATLVGEKHSQGMPIAPDIATIRLSGSARHPLPPEKAVHAGSRLMCIPAKVVFVAAGRTRSPISSHEIPGRPTIDRR
jgi:hypothetical protein